jgi:hypothetical protein
MERCSNMNDSVFDIGQRILKFGPDFPRIVCLCGSSRFKDDHLAALKSETLAGRIVITMGLYGHMDGLDMGGSVKVMLDELHLRKIDLADEILVIDVGRHWCPSCERWCDPDYQTGRYPYENGTTECCGARWVMRPYIGESTRREIDYVSRAGKHVRYWSREQNPEA